MPRFKPYNYDQTAMVVINYEEQLQPGTFEHALYYLATHKLDLSIFTPPPPPPPASTMKTKDCRASPAGLTAPSF